MPNQSWSLPPIDILDDVRPLANEAANKAQARIIERTLAEFGIKARVRNMHAGPRMTKFGLKLAADIPFRKVQRLEQDLGVATAGALVEIEPPQPSYPYLALLVENYGRPQVGLRRILDSPQFHNTSRVLPVSLGLDTFSQPVVIDLAAQPHLLIGGTSGAGKSVCVHALLASLLMTLSPDQVRLLLIDPIEVELQSYNNLPHLLDPVITQTGWVPEALSDIVAEIDGRYQLMAAAQVRDINAYNQKMAQQREAPLPFIVIIIDNLFDLMVTAPVELEQLLARLAQKARAAGVHLVMATLRTSVATVAGSIKANFPGRIAFRTADVAESRLILDASGAEMLLGQGDMLYKAPQTNRLQRIQGIFVTEAERQRLIAHWQQQA